MIPFPNKRYDIVYADPPWSYNDKMQGHGAWGGALDQYQTQSDDYIKWLDVESICNNDCVLFMWAVSPLLPIALQVMNCWGFKYKTIAFVWNKKTVNWNQIYNMGRWTMASVELCLLGVKGKPRRIKNNVKQLVECVREKHSKKPDVVRNRIVELMGDVSRIELFSRQKTQGWDVWGNDSNIYHPNQNYILKAQIENIVNNKLWEANQV